MRKFRNERGFTLMELMVVIVIVAILAAVAVPLYINYVKDAQRTEAKGAIGAIFTANQAYFQKSGSFGAPTYAPALDTLKTQGLLDLTEVDAKWTFNYNLASADSYTVTATNRADGTLQVAATYGRSSGGSFAP
ncbi:MAG TPA: prepilin-type N-terminal cleavage/methylation domain-containing protein [Candidatus Sulfotelmatobacter sp.]|nr:prepilin-type N-terminal cleavage/methylation domain-containing protein [Candidatus Sulfotelmatobacter sp.]